MKKLKLLILAFIVPLVGCVSIQGPVALDPEQIKTATGLGVAMNPLPASNLHMPGADCLLCLAAAQMANSSLDKHAEALDSLELSQVKADVMQKLREDGIRVVDVAEGITLNKLPKDPSKLENATRRDFSEYRDKYNISHLLLIDIHQLGMLRTYASYIPTSDPKGYVRGVAYLVDLSDNTYKWYLPIDVQRSADGDWDEPPEFPGLTNAYFQAIEMVKEEVVSAF